MVVSDEMSARSAIIRNAPGMVSLTFRSGEIHMPKCPPGCTCKRHTAKIGYQPKPGIQRRCEPGCTCARHAVSEERRANISQSLTGRVLSEEHRTAVAVGATTHGQSGKGRNDQTRAYKSWDNMKQRCLNPASPNFEYYGARGITVCARWLESFENFYADMGDRPPGLTLERINNEGNYEPGNCRWATVSEQNSNQRRRTRRKVSA